MSKVMLTDEQIKSASIVQDIAQRHQQCAYFFPTKDCVCVNCKKQLVLGVKVLSILPHKGKTLLLLCDQNCLSEHEQKEREFFYCGNLEKIPAVSIAEQLSKRALGKAYAERKAKRQS